MSRRGATVHLGLTALGSRWEAAFPAEGSKAWSRFKSAGRPHLAGAHLYGQKRGNATLYGLRATNGVLEVDGSWQGIFGFTQLTLDYRGPGVMVLEHALPSQDKAFTFLPRQKFSMRFAVAPTEAEARAALRLEDEPWAGVPLLGTYGPTNHLLPEVDGHDYESENAAKYAGDLLEPVGGALWRPKGVPGAELDGMAPGGDGIFPDGHGYQRARSYVLHSRHAFDGWMDRVGPVYLYDIKGRQLSPHSFAGFLPHAEVQQGPRTTNRDLPQFLTMDQGWGQQAYKRLGPDMGEALWDWQAMAISHIIRVLHHGIAAWEFTHDPMIADDLLAIFRAYQFLDWSHRSDAPLDAPWHSSLTELRAKANAQPMDGAPIDRAAAWMGYLGAQLVRMGHVGIKDWLSQWCELIEVSATWDGINNVQAYHAYMPANTMGTQLFHDALIKWAYYTAAKQLDRDGAPLLLRWVNRVLDNARMPFLPYIWHADQRGPPWFIATHLDGQPIRVSGEHATGCGKPGYSTGYLGTVEHLWPVLAGAWDLSRDPMVLAIALKVWIPHATEAQRLAFCRQAHEKNWIAAMQRMLELREAG